MAQIRYTKEDRIDNMEYEIELLKANRRAYYRAFNVLEEIDIMAVKHKDSDEEENEMVELIKSTVEDLEILYENRISEINDKIATRNNCINAERGIYEYEKTDE